MKKFVGGFQCVRASRFSASSCKSKLRILKSSVAIAIVVVILPTKPTDEGGSTRTHNSSTNLPLSVMIIKRPVFINVKQRANIPEIIQHFPSKLSIPRVVAKAFLA
ncbi:hypothetical protein ACMFMG_010809 [Clarireedia jacksonii]